MVQYKMVLIGKPQSPYGCPDVLTAGVVVARFVVSGALFAGLLVPFGGLPAGAGEGDPWEMRVGTQFDLLGDEDIATGAAIDADGNIVVVGRTRSGTPPNDVDDDGLVLRVDPNTDPDASFGFTGFVRYDDGGSDSFEDVVIDDAGRIIVVGRSYASSAPFPNSYPIIVRLLPNGDPDPTFGDGGVVNGPESNTSYDAVIVEDDGSIVVAGTAVIDSVNQADVILAKYSATGELDGTFGGTFDAGSLPGLSSHEFARGIAQLDDGAYVVVGMRSFPSFSNPANVESGGLILRYTSAGALDEGFDFDGVLFLDEDEKGDVVDVLADSAGRVVVSERLDHTRSSIVMRLLPNGALDPTFGVAGAVDIAGRPAAIEHDAAGRVVVASTSIASFELSRYSADGIADGAFPLSTIDFFDDSEFPAAVLAAPDGELVIVGHGLTNLDPAPSGSFDFDLVVLRATNQPGGSGGGGGGGGGRSATTTTTTTVAASPEGAESGIAGSDRIETAILASRNTFASAISASGATTALNIEAKSAVLARSDHYADALAGTPLAVSLVGPLLLTPSAQLDARVLAEIDRLLGGTGEVHLLGGRSALGESVDHALTEAGYTIVRHAGATRYETAVSIAHALGSPSPLIEVTGTDFPDALSAGSVAAVIGGAVLLTNGPSQDAATQAYLGSRPGVPRFAIGGPAARADPTATGIVGVDRYATSAATAELFFSAPSHVGLASGANFPDALAGGAHIAVRAGPLLLTSPSILAPRVADYLRSRAGSIEHGVMYGGSAAISASVRTEFNMAFAG